jgi:hypothetical protein
MEAIINAGKRGDFNMVEYLTEIGADIEKDHNDKNKTFYMVLSCISLVALVVITYFRGDFPM